MFLNVAAMMGPVTADLDAPEDPPELLAKRAGEVIRRRRHEVGLTQQQLAARARVGSTLVGELEKGLYRERNGLMMTKLSQALGWPGDAIERMLDGDPEPDPLGAAMADRRPAQEVAGAAALSGLDIPDDLTPTETALIRAVIDGIKARREQG